MNANRALILLGATMAGALLLSRGGGGGSAGARNTPLDPLGASHPELTSADVAMDGVSVVGETIGIGAGASTLFTATLADPADAPRVEWVGVQHPVHSHSGVHGTWDTVTLHDDGTHGDHVAHDGVYSFLDVDDHVGPHHSDGPAGQNRYTFQGRGTDATLTNQIQRQVEVR